MTMILFESALILIKFWTKFNILGLFTDLPSIIIYSWHFNINFPLIKTSNYWGIAGKTLKTAFFLGRHSYFYRTTFLDFITPDDRIVNVIKCGRLKFTSAISEMVSTKSTRCNFIQSEQYNVYASQHANKDVHTQENNHLFTVARFVYWKKSLLFVGLNKYTRNKYLNMLCKLLLNSK